MLEGGDKKVEKKFFEQNNLNKNILDSGTTKIDRLANHAVIDKRLCRLNNSFDDRQ